MRRSVHAGLGVLAALPTLLLLACGNDDEPCLSRWARRSAGAGYCRPEAACAQIANQPERTVTFIVDLAATGTTKGADGTYPELPEAERKEMWSCVASTLRGRGVGAIEPYGRLADVHVTARWPEVRDLLELEMVLGMEVGCHTKDVCTHCDALVPDACAQDAFCSVLHASPIGADRMCAAAPKPVGCQSSGIPCDDAITFGQDPKGACWQFGSACVPRGWRSDRQACGPADAGEYARCQ